MMQGVKVWQASPTAWLLNEQLKSPNALPTLPLQHQPHQLRTSLISSDAARGRRATERRRRQGRMESRQQAQRKKRGSARDAAERGDRGRGGRRDERSRGDGGLTSCPHSPAPAAPLLSRRARNVLGTATQHTRGNNSPSRSPRIHPRASCSTRRWSRRTCPNRRHCTPSPATPPPSSDRRPPNHSSTVFPASGASGSGAAARGVEGRTALRRAGSPCTAWLGDRGRRRRRRAPPCVRR
jgi:hypothetical protein